MTKTLFRTGLLTLAAVAFSVGVAGAAVLVQDNFNYPDGTDLEFLGNWSKHGGTNAPQTQSGQAIIQHGIETGDVNTLFSGGARGPSDKTYTCLDLIIPSGTSTNSNEYFTHLREDAGFVFPVRVWTGQPQAAGDYSIAISISSQGSGDVNLTFWAADLTFDQTYRIVTRYDGVTGAATLWVDPASEGDTSIDAPQTITGLIPSNVALRQDSSVPGYTLNVDNLVVASSFAEVCPAAAPSASQAGMLVMALLMLGGGTVFMLRRRANGTFGA